MTKALEITERKVDPQKSNVPFPHFVFHKHTHKRRKCLGSKRFGEAGRTSGTIQSSGGVIIGGGGGSGAGCRGGRGDGNKVRKPFIDIVHLRT